VFTTFIFVSILPLNCGTPRRMAVRMTSEQESSKSDAIFTTRFARAGSDFFQKTGKIHGPAGQPMLPLPQIQS